MTDVVYYVASSLDGYIATPDGGVEWLAAFQNAGEDYGFSQFYASVDAILLGRRTYEQSLTFGDWPYPGRPGWVFSRRGITTSRNDVTVTSRTPQEVMRELERKGLGRAWLVGGAALAGSFRAAGLITEYIVSIVPTILGAGVPLFDSPGPVQELALVDSRQFSRGVVQLRYVPGSAPVRDPEA